MARGNKQQLAHWIDGPTPGVVHGLKVRDPQSATLTATYDGGVIRLTDSTGVLTEYTFQPSTKAFTASKDTYVYVDGTTHAIAYYEAANGGTKPVIGTDIAANSQFLAKVVTDGTRVTSGGVLDLRQMGSCGQKHVIAIKSGFASTTVGDVFVPCPFNGRILYAESSVTTALAGTDAGTVTLAIGSNDKYTAVTNGVLTIPLSSALSTRNQCAPSAANVFTEGDCIKATSAKTTSGGEAMVFLIVERLA